MSRFVEHVTSGTHEYIERDGCVTIEFATSEVLFNEEKQAILRAASEKLPEGSRWIAYVCETCRGYDSERPVHVSIERLDHWPISYSAVKTLFDAATKSPSGEVHAEDS